jgi:hypothetical protein
MVAQLPRKGMKRKSTKGAKKSRDSLQIFTCWLERPGSDAIVRG